MKKLLIILTVGSISSAAIASPYLSLNYGFMNSNNDVSVEQGDLKASPDQNTQAMGAAIGYRFSPSWSLELGYTHFESEGEQSIETGIAPEIERELSSEFSANQITLLPKYRFTLTEKLSLDLGAGVSVTQYETTSKYSIEQDFEMDGMDNEEAIHSSNSSDWLVGGIATVGIDYAFTQHFSLGTQLSYQADEFAQNTNVNLNATYNF